MGWVWKCVCEIVDSGCWIGVVWVLSFVALALAVRPM